MIGEMIATAGLQAQEPDANSVWSVAEAKPEPSVKDTLAAVVPYNQLVGDAAQAMTQHPALKIESLLDRVRDIMMEEVDMRTANLHKYMIENPDASAAGISMRISAECFDLTGTWPLKDRYDGVKLHHDFDDTDTLEWVHHLLVEYRSEIGDLLLACAASPFGNGLRLRDSHLGRLLDEPPVRIRLPEQANCVSDTLYRLGHRRRRHIMRQQFRTLIEHCSARPDDEIGKNYLHVTGGGLAFSDLDVTETSGVSIKLCSWMKCGVFNSVVQRQAASSMDAVMEWACFTNPKSIPQVDAYHLVKAFEYPRC